MEEGREEQAIERLLVQARGRVQRRQLSSTLQCLLCGGPPKVVDKARPAHTYCNVERCQRTFHGLDQFLNLDGKRLREPRGGYYKNLGRIPLPDDILCELLLLVYGEGLDSLERYDELMEMRTISRQFRRVIDLCVVARVEHLSADIISGVPEEALTQFSGLTSLSLHPLLTTLDRMHTLLESVRPESLRVLEVEEFPQGQLVRVVEGVQSPMVGLITNTQLARFENLQELSLESVSEITDATLQHLRHLMYLYLDDNNTLTDQCLIHAGQLVNLVLSHVSGLHDLSALHSLERLFLGEQTEHVTLQRLGSLTNLTALGLQGERDAYSNDALASLTQLQHLALLSEDPPQEPDDAMLSSLTQLRSLVMHSSGQVTIDSVSLLSNLVVLAFVDTNASVIFSPEGVRPFSETLVILDPCDIRSRETSRSLAKSLTLLRHLQYLNLTTDWYGGVRDKHLRGLVELRILLLRDGGDLRTKAVRGSCFTSLTSLLDLSLQRNPDVTNKRLATLTSLVKLNLSYNRLITDEGLAPLKNLHSLFAAGNRLITVVGLSSLPRLRYVAVRLSPQLFPPPPTRKHTRAYDAWAPLLERESHIEFDLQSWPEDVQPSLLNYDWVWSDLPLWNLGLNGL